MTASTSDDAGTSVPLWLPWGPNQGAAPPDVRNRIEMVIRDSSVPGLNLIWSVLLVVVLLTTAWASAAVLPALWMSWGPLGLVLIGSFLLRRRFLAPFNTRSIRETMLAAGHCASCGYDLAGMPGVAGLRVCPECSARWHIRPDTVAPGDRPVWNRGPIGRLCEDLGLRGVLLRETHSGVDDRGRAVEIVYPVPRRRLPSQWLTIPKDDAALIERRLSSLGMGSRVLMLFVVVFFLGSAVLGITADLVQGAPLSSVAARLPLPILLTLVVAFRLQYPVVINKREIVEIMLRFGRCGSCAGDLGCVSMGEDGVATCVHCGAGWRTGPMQAAVPQARGAEERRRAKDLPGSARRE